MKEVAIKDLTALIDRLLESGSLCELMTIDESNRVWISFSNLFSNQEVKDLLEQLHIYTQAKAKTNARKLNFH